VDAGLNNIPLSLRANIRDQCSWIHMREPREGNRDEQRSGEDGSNKSFIVRAARRARKKGTKFVKMEVENESEVRDSIVRTYHANIKRDIEIKADLVILATPLISISEFERISKLKVPLGGMDSSMGAREAQTVGFRHGRYLYLWNRTWPPRYS
jgi:heterodisulfide reductase subunit A-like polyferredoxin